ncbi:hypothetical protein L195_g052031 [Trifolium pratense]|uniref:Uncharacterized protein n=1 Tax=Trifolium pratense TaxID=57577 RepID=A0A2K3K2V6_TRIPR|nr:hypothetical protein L195_g052031 [Trifolium pratense]
MPLEPRASWFSPKCVEAQQLTGHLVGQGWPMRQWVVSFILERETFGCACFPLRRPHKSHKFDFR